MVRGMFTMIDTNGDNQTTRCEVGIRDSYSSEDPLGRNDTMRSAGLNAAFDIIDANNDGLIDLAEMKTGFNELWSNRVQYQNSRHPVLELYWNYWYDARHTPGNC